VLRLLALLDEVGLLGAADALHAALVCEKEVGKKKLLKKIKNYAAAVGQ